MLVVVVKEIQFEDFQQNQVVIPIGTAIKAEPENNLGYFNGTWFELFQSDYSTIKWC